MFENHRVIHGVFLSISLSRVFLATRHFIFRAQVLVRLHCLRWYSEKGFSMRARRLFIIPSGGTKGTEYILRGAVARPARIVLYVSAFVSLRT